MKLNFFFNRKTDKKHSFIKIEKKDNKVSWSGIQKAHQLFFIKANNFRKKKQQKKTFLYNRKNNTIKSKWPKYTTKIYSAMVSQSNDHFEWIKNILVQFVYCTIDY